MKRAFEMKLKKNVCQASQVFFFRTENQTSKKVADTKL